MSLQLNVTSEEGKAEKLQKLLNIRSSECVRNITFMESKSLLDSTEVPLNRWLTLYSAIVENEFLTVVSEEKPQRQTLK